MEQIINQPCDDAAKTFQVIHGGRVSTPSKPKPPSKSRFIDKMDRNVIVRAFVFLRRSIRWLARHRQISEQAIEDVLRDHIDDLQGQLHAERARNQQQPYLLRRAA